jgi:hypothetical protein
MPSGTKTILVFEDGSTLEATSGGDQHWIISPNGSAVLCPLQQACLYWAQYEETLTIGPTRPISLVAPPAPVVATAEVTASPVNPMRPTVVPPAVVPYVSSGYVPPPEARPPANRIVCGPRDKNEDPDYSPWQRELLNKLGLTPEELARQDAAGKKNKGKKKK